MAHAAGTGAVRDGPGGVGEHRFLCVFLQKHGATDLAQSVWVFLALKKMPLMSALSPMLPLTTVVCGARSCCTAICTWSSSSTRNSPSDSRTCTWSLMCQGNGGLHARISEQASTVGLPPTCQSSCHSSKLSTCFIVSGPRPIADLWPLMWASSGFMTCVHTDGLHMVTAAPQLWLWRWLSWPGHPICGQPQRTCAAPHRRNAALSLECWQTPAAGSSGSPPAP